VAATASNGIVFTKLPRNTNFGQRERKFHVIFALGGESSRERKFQGTKVLPMELSLPGAKVRGNESSSYLPLQPYCTLTRWSRDTGICVMVLVRELIKEVKVRYGMLCSFEKKMKIFT